MIYLHRPAKAVLVSVNLQTQMFAMIIYFGKVPTQGSHKVMICDQALLTGTAYHGYPDMLV